MAEFYSATVRLFDRFCGPVLLRDSQLWGGKTRNAIIQFERDTAQSQTGKLSTSLFQSLGLIGIEKIPKAAILVIDQRSDKPARTLEGMTQAQVLEYLPRLAAMDTRQIDLFFLVQNQSYS